MIRHARLLLALLLCAAPVSAAEFITASLAVTNGTLTNYSLTVNGSARLWASNTTATTVQTNVNPLSAASNLFAQIGAWPFTAVSARMTNTNTITLRGYNLTVSLAGPWASLTLTTNQSTNHYALMLPMVGSAVLPLTVRTQQASEAVAGFSAYSTNAFATNANALSNHLSLGPLAQHVLGAKTFHQLSGFAFNLTNGWFWSATNVNPVLSNGVNYGLGFRSYGAGAESLQLGSNALAQSQNTVAIGTDALATNANAFAAGRSAIAYGASSTVVGNSAVASNSYGTALGYIAIAGDIGATALGENAQALEWLSIALGVGSEAFDSNSIAIGGGAYVESGELHGSGIAIGRNAGVLHTNSVALGANVETTAANQIRFGSTLHHVSIPGRLEAAFQTNSTFAGTNKVMSTSDWAWEHQTVSTLANGVNFAIAFTNTAVILTAGPTAAFSIDGISGNNRVGRFLILINRTGQNCTLARESGSEPTPANRIDTLTGGSITLRAGGSATLLYDASVSRWIVLSVNLGTDGFGAQSATNAIPFLNGSGTNTMFYTDNGVTTPNLRVIGASAQITNLTEWLNSSGTKLAFISTNGGMVLGGDGIAPRTNDLVTSGAINLTVAGNSNVFLRAQGPGELAQVNGTQGQTNHLYGTWSSSTSFERLRIGYNAGSTEFLVASDAGSGGGTARGLAFGAAKNSGGGFTRHWNIPPTSGNFEGIDPTNSIILGARSLLRSGLSSGRLTLLSAAGTANGAALQMGGTNGSVPMVTTNAHMAEWRTADNANLTSVTASNFIAGKNLVAAVAGGGLEVKEGSNARMGTAVLASGTATVSTTAVTANSRIFLTTQVMGATICLPYIHSRTAATSFVITNSVGTGGASTIAWMIVEPAP